MDSSRHSGFLLPRYDVLHALGRNIEEFDVTPMEQRLERAVLRRAENIGTWFLHHPLVVQFSYLLWNHRLGSCHVLWVHGVDGVGKETLSAMLAASIAELHDPGLAVGWYSCSRFDYRRRKAEFILRSLAIQIARQDADLFNFFTGLIIGHLGLDKVDASASAEEKYDYLDTSHLCKFFPTALARFRIVFLIITNIDQCTGKDALEVCELLMLLASEYPGRIRILFTACDEMSSLRLEKSPYCHDIEIENDSSDLLKHIVNNSTHLAMVMGPDRQRQVHERMMKYPETGFIGADVEMRYYLRLLRRERGPIIEDMDNPLAVNWNTEEVRALEFAQPQAELDHLFTSLYRPKTPRHRSIFKWLVKLVYLTAGTVGLELSFDELRGALDQAIRTIGLDDETSNESNHTNGLDPAKVTEAEVFAIMGPVVQRTPDGRGLEFTHITYFNLVDRHFEIFQDRNNPMEECLSLLASLCFSELLHRSRIEPVVAFEHDLYIYEERQQAYPFYSYAATHWDLAVAGKEEDFIPDIQSVIRTGSNVFVNWFLEFVRALHPHWKTEQRWEVYQYFSRNLREQRITGHQALAAMGLPKTFELAQVTRDASSPLGTPFRCAAISRAALLGPGISALSLPVHIHLPGLAIERRRLELLYRMTKPDRLDQLDVDGSIFIPAMRTVLSCGLFLCDGDYGDMRYIVGLQQQIVRSFLNSLVGLCCVVLSAGPLIDDHFVQGVRLQQFLYDPSSFVGRPVARRVFGNVLNAVEELHLRLCNYRELRPLDEVDPSHVHRDLAEAARTVLQRLEHERTEALASIETEADPPEFARPGLGFGGSLDLDPDSDPDVWLEWLKHNAKYWS